MHFEATFPATRISNSALIYRADEYSFDVVPSPTGFASVLVNDLNLEVIESGRVVSVWGICPHAAWERTVLNPPDAEFGDVFFVTDKPLERSVSIRISQQEYWPVLADLSCGWVHVKGKNGTTSSIKILTGVVLDLNKQGNLCGIWLRPEELPMFG